ncbi:glycosyltransferase [Prosthecobacter dejongeii]|uniref:Glycosyltransferase involved in cell wall biosynthesis n=1 Tax=Prosthecobacter dejongeii TaxID=48465 RepID=A0A7W7YNV5_9BACT|nr:glycosyltransferase involved in cell wall biosynthesis [Prosthecobacter dejongeii]
MRSELTAKLSKADWFLQQQQKNRWFQQRCIQVLKGLARDGKPRVVFAYSYAAKEILVFAKQRGWQTVLGQIDPGPLESELVLKEYARLNLHPSYLYQSPAEYWQDWRQETALADRILVNSPWSLECLQQQGVAAGKMEVIPCAYEVAFSASQEKRSWPNQFTQARPLRVLFLGQTIIRKGIHILMKAASQMLDDPIQFEVAGGGLDHPNLGIPSNVNWRGPVSREETGKLYEAADVFILPTLSDGFAITQLEALARGIPVIASRLCGQVVRDQENGLILDEVTPEAITGALRKLLESPLLLEKMSQHATVPEVFSIQHLGAALTLQS